MEYKIDPNAGFDDLWKQYIQVLHNLIIIRQRRPQVRFLSAFSSMFENTFSHLTSEKLVPEIKNAWDSWKNVEDNRIPAELLQQEIASFINGYYFVTKSSPATNIPPSTSNWLSREATAKDIINAGKTLLESILDALGDILPLWVKGILKVLREVLEVAAG